MYNKSDKIINYCIKNINNQINLNIECYKIRLDYLLKMRELEAKNKPNKILKNKYYIWNKKISKIDNEIDDVLSLMNKELIFIKKNSLH